MFAATVARAPEADAIRYFDGRMTSAQLDEASDALAVALLGHGFSAGDRLVLFTQNNPAYVIGMLAAWKAGGIAVSANPMYKERELGHLLRDSGATAVLCLDELYPVVSALGIRTVITFSGLDGQTRDDPRVFPSPQRLVIPDALDLGDLLNAFAGLEPPPASPAPDDPAFLVYTSGTTGDPKGAVLTHRNFVFNARSYREWMQLEPGDTILGLAPLFHITGLVGHGVLALLLPAPLVLAHRFEPSVMVDAVREHRPVFSVGAITAYAAMAGVPGAGRDDFRSLTKIWSGGAPIAPAVGDQLGEKIGGYIHNAYGLTETSSITHLVPPGRRAPVDPASGALSIGVPIASVRSRIVGEDGKELPPGEVGEVLISGPQVATGYWQRPDATEASFPGGELHTGDVGFMDEAGWFYLVDRKKDMIIASGYKVWPREVEDVLYGHPAVREAAVIGVPDAYRGETVHAFVSLQPGAEVGAEELIAFCKERMAAYKYPRAVFFVDELPKTASGKILRRELR
ncbi:long-chain fatty acid--CoA ligase [Amycolatopsis sp. K13G38]|uniref:Long-chain fatty acid--CoA ligase n=2 Tax=Amycolatopsis acididurans TaxID=2724524 RepID=A0ABX1JCZ3_9PSEU|nr:long-chain fatty acid--CoA ligase [Amycolatopsis acididurans]